MPPDKFKQEVLSAYIDSRTLHLNVQASKLFENCQAPELDQMLPQLQSCFTLAEHELQITNALFTDTSKIDPRSIYKRTISDLAARLTLVLSDFLTELQESEVTLKQRQTVEALFESMEESMKHALRLWLKYKELAQFQEKYSKL